MIDIFILGGLYTLRVVIGVFLAGVQVAPWLLMFSFFFFFALSMAKRHVEIVNAGSNSAKALRSRAEVIGRLTHRLRWRWASAPTLLQC